VISSSFYVSGSSGSLDPSLRQLTGDAWDAMSSPLSVRRFVREYGMNCPSSAMKLATDALLSDCKFEAGHDGPHVEVETLCQVCGAALLGSLPRSRAQKVYSTDSSQSRQGHTGSLLFDKSRAQIKIPQTVDYLTARLSVAHEIGHLLIHKRGTAYDHATLRLGSSPQEEALAEYAARLLLIPSRFCNPSPNENLAEYAIKQATRLRVTIHSVVTRFGDPDVRVPSVRGAILWRMHPDVSASEPLSNRLTPQWHLCPDAFIPIRNCKARSNSLVSSIASVTKSAAMSSLEEVNIGTLIGYFRVDAFAWGSVDDGTRLVLSVFKTPL